VFDPQDPASILRDYAYEHDSPYIAVFGGDWKKQSTAKKILSTRNTWFHFGDDPTVAMLREAARTVRDFVSSSGLHIVPRIEALLRRLDDLATGRYPTETETAPITARTHQPVEELTTPVDLPRPRIGGTWLGEIPPTRYRITPTGDVLHPDTMRSLRDRVSSDFGEKVRVWTAVPPRGGELWVDADGAVGGYIGATPRLLGYLGPDPEGDVARGFFTAHFYAVDGDEIADLDSGERRKTPFAQGLEDGAMLRVTTYGDVLVVRDADGLERVATVKDAEWFPGHLG
jgi:hypothetical protein